jgi:Trk K+ transport system NAD-binding subunit
VRVARGSELVGVSIAAVRDRFAGGATLAAVQREDRLLAPPPEDLLLRADDVIAIVGTDAQLRTLERACLGTPGAPTGTVAPLPIRREGT